MDGKKTILGLLKKVFGCPHRHISRPITPAPRPGLAAPSTYVVCLDCGDHFSYDWKQMRINERIDPPPPSTW